MDGLSPEFFTGSARYLDEQPGHDEGTAKIFVRVAFANLPGEHLAQLDTGAAWTMLPPDMAEALDLHAGDGEEVNIDTRFGKVAGRLEKVSLTLVADKGDSLEIDATVFVSKSWRGRMFIGYTGVLQSLRFGCDCPRSTFYFGM